MSPLAKYLFVFLINHTTPGASVYSMHVLPECGTTKDAPACELKPVCLLKSPMCAAPRWSGYRSGWVRVETREEAAERYWNASEALVRASTYMSRCKAADGTVVEECSTVFWPEGPQGLACGMLSSSLWESGYREDIMIGAPPAGRGPDGEVCVMQIMPEYIKQFADWQPPKPQKEMSEDDWATEVLGSDQEHLERCYRVGGRMLSRFRGAARYACANVGWTYGMYAMYGTGGKCAPATMRAAAEETARTGLVIVTGKENRPADWVAQRVGTYRACMKNWPDKEVAPEWLDKWVQNRESVASEEGSKLAYSEERLTSEAAR